MSYRKVLEIFRSRVNRLLAAQTALRELNFPTEKPRVNQANALDGDGWPDNRFDVVLTSPPYGCGMDYERAFRLQSKFVNYFSRNTLPTHHVIGRRHPLGAGEEALPYSELKSSWYWRIKEAERVRTEMFLQYLADFRSFLRLCQRHLSKN